MTEKTITLAVPVWEWDEEALDSVIVDKEISVIPMPNAVVIEPGTFQGTPAELARMVLKQVENHPETFNMSGWAMPEGMAQGSCIGGYEDDIIKGVNVCGTTMCVAGYVQLFTEGKIDETTVEENAGKALGLDEDNAATLFYGSAENAVRALEAIADGSFVPVPPAPVIACWCGGSEGIHH